MKIIAQVYSKRGHKEKDTIIIMSEIELITILKLVRGNDKPFNTKKFLGDGSRHYNASKSIKKSLHEYLPANKKKNPL